MHICIIISRIKLRADIFLFGDNTGFTVFWLGRVEGSDNFFIIRIIRYIFSTMLFE